MHSPKRKLIYRSFLEGVVRLADHKYQDLLTTSQRLSRALFHNSLPYACHDNQDNFRNKREDAACTALVSSYERPMMELFLSLCPAGKQTLQIRQLLVFLESRNLGTSSDVLNGKMVELYFKSLNGTSNADAAKMLARTQTCLCIHMYECACDGPLVGIACMQLSVPLLP